MCRRRHQAINNNSVTITKTTPLNVTSHHTLSHPMLGCPSQPERTTPLSSPYRGWTISENLTSNSPNIDHFTALPFFQAPPIKSEGITHAQSTFRFNFPSDIIFCRDESCRRKFPCRSFSVGRLPFLRHIERLSNNTAHRATTEIFTTDDKYFPDEFPFQIPDTTETRILNFSLI